jgi:hypothetical protein
MTIVGVIALLGGEGLKALPLRSYDPDSAVAAVAHAAREDDFPALRIKPRIITPA